MTQVLTTPTEAPTDDDGRMVHLVERGKHKALCGKSLTHIWKGADDDPVDYIVCVEVARSMGVKI